MGSVEPVQPVQQFVAILWSGGPAIDRAREKLREKWGAFEWEGPDRPFDITDYYEAEMGPDLVRRLVAFRQLVPPESLVEAKLACNQIEDALRNAEGRTVNLDVGYLDHNKIVLGSVKFAGQKNHLGQGIYADLVARYARGRYRPFEWTFPDFKDGRYDEELAHMRRAYLDRLKEWRRNCQSGGSDLTNRNQTELP